MNKFIFINSIMKNQSLCDGPGYRTVLFLQGCNLRCKGCHNKESWDIKKGKKVLIEDLANELKKKSFNKKITISGGEPLMQFDSLYSLLLLLEGYDICLYTGYQIDKVPKQILRYLKYIKTGKYIEELKTSTKPFVGSENQEMWELENGKPKKKW